MKDAIKSIIRHLLTGASAWAVNAEILSPADASTLTAALVTALTIVVTRAVMWGLGQLKKDKIEGLGVNLLLCGVTVSTALACGGLVSCSTLADVPVEVCVSSGEYGSRVCYSTDEGLEADVDVDALSGK